MLRLPEAHHWSLYHRHGQEVPPRALRLCLLPQAAQQGHLQGAERQALLPELLCEALLLGHSHHPPQPAPPTATVTQGPRPGMTGQSNRNWNLVLAGADAGQDCGGRACSHPHQSFRALLSLLWLSQALCTSCPPEVEAGAQSSPGVSS